MSAEFWREGTRLRFCSAEEEKELEGFFTPRLDRIDGGARTLSMVQESIRLCAARKKHFQTESRTVLKSL